MHVARDLVGQVSLSSTRFGAPYRSKAAQQSAERFERSELRSVRSKFEEPPAREQLPLEANPFVEIRLARR